MSRKIVFLEHQNDSHIYVKEKVQKKRTANIKYPHHETKININSLINHRKMSKTYGCELHFPIVPSFLTHKSALRNVKNMPPHEFYFYKTILKFV